MSNDLNTPTRNKNNLTGFLEKSFRGCLQKPTVNMS